MSKHVGMMFLMLNTFTLSSAYPLLVITYFVRCIYSLQWQLWRDELH